MTSSGTPEGTTNVGNGFVVVMIVIIVVLFVTVLFPGMARKQVKEGTTLESLNPGGSSIYDAYQYGE